jgi:hypothetical protein
MMIGIGIPISQSNMPFMLSSTLVSFAMQARTIGSPSLQPLKPA